MSFYCPKTNRSRLIRYSVTADGISNESISWRKVSGRVDSGFVDERAGLVRVVSDSGSSGNGASLHMLNTDLRPATASSRLKKIAANSYSGKISGAAFDNHTVYIIADFAQDIVYAVNTVSGKPVLLGNILDKPERNAFIANLADTNFYKWGENRFFEVGLAVDDNEPQGIELTMYVYDGETPVTEQVYRLSIPDTVQHDYTGTSALKYREAVGYDSDNGVIVVPVTYFSNTGRNECFFVLSYSEVHGFTEIGKLFESGFNSRVHIALVQNGSIYAICDNMIRSSSLNAAAIDFYTF
jgi:hypothetical protein